MICENCSANMISVKNETVQGWECPKCGWNVLTTNIDAIYKDVVEYCIFTERTEKIDKEQIKVISKISGVNFIEAKKILDKNSYCLFEGKAQEIKSIIEQLDNANIKYTITPNYNY